MLFRKIERRIAEYFASDSDKVLIVTGARQIGKSFIIRHCATEFFKNIVEINLIEDVEGNGIFKNVRSVDDFDLALAAFSTKALGNPSDTLIFLDEIQEYPHLLTLLKFLREDRRYRYVASGSLLGVTLKKSNSIPLGSIDIMKMFPLDFEEFMIANNVGRPVIDLLHESFINMLAIPEEIHNRVMDLYK